jgi:hypothetical protein
MATTAVDIALVLFRALDEREQDELYERLTDARLRRIAGEESVTAVMIRSLRRVAEHVEGAVSPDSYRAAWRELRAAGEDVEEFSRVVRHFGTWRRAKEALELSDTNSVRRIEARFRFRRVGKVWRYTEETLRETLGRCVDYYGRPPMVAEFDWWRQRELELAAAQGNPDLQLPSAHPYRKRWSTWEGGLLHFGYAPEAISERLEQP